MSSSPPSYIGASIPDMHKLDGKRGETERERESFTSPFILSLCAFEVFCTTQKTSEFGSVWTQLRYFVAV